MGGGGGLKVRQPGSDAVQDNGQRSHQADDAASGDRASADVEDVGGADVAGAHVGDGLGPRRQHAAQASAKELDQRRQHQATEHATGHHDRANPRTDDVTHSQQFGGDFRRD